MNPPRLDSDRSGPSLAAILLREEPDDDEEEEDDRKEKMTMGTKATTATQSSGIGYFRDCCLSIEQINGLHEPTRKGCTQPEITGGLEPCRTKELSLTSLS
jgi:hypothetical protein